MAEQIIFAVGDIGGPPNDNPGAARTARLIKRLIQEHPQAPVLVLGDNAYPNGTLAEYQSFYTPTWGDEAVKSRTWPCPGNHDYNANPSSPHYYTYFSPRAGTPATSWYSFDAADWHIISLNTETEVRPNSPQLLWLKQDLETRRQQRILAFFHRQRFGSGNHTDDDTSKHFWDLLFQHRAELILSGHAHHYERFAPQTPAERRDPRGIRQFVVGTGGRELRREERRKENQEAADFSSFGILKLILRLTNYDWEFIPAEGSTFTDKSSVPSPTNH